LFGTHTDGPSISFAGFWEIIASETKISVMDPQFSESELAVRDQFECAIKHCLCFGLIARLFFPNCVIEPKIDVPSPEAFLFSRRQLTHCSFIDFSNPIIISKGFFKEGQIDPSLIVQGIFGKQIFVMTTSFTEHNFINLSRCAMFFLEAEV
jgi:hypothetical protein